MYAEQVRETGKRAGHGSRWCPVGNVEVALEGLPARCRRQESAADESTHAHAALEVVRLALRSTRAHKLVREAVGPEPEPGPVPEPVPVPEPEPEDNQRQTPQPLRCRWALTPRRG